MAIQESENLEIPKFTSPLCFIIAVIDGCIQSERAVRELWEAQSRSQYFQMFYSHRQAGHTEPAGRPLAQLRLMFEYLEDLLGLDDSTARNYEQQIKSGMHVMLANVQGNVEATTFASILGRAQAHTGRVLGYGHTARPLTFSVSPSVRRDS